VLLCLISEAAAIERISFIQYRVFFVFYLRNDTDYINLNLRKCMDDNFDKIV
jgi:hypothetical protein